MFCNNQSKNQKHLKENLLEEQVSNAEIKLADMEHQIKKDYVK